MSDMEQGTRAMTVCGWRHARELVERLLSQGTPAESVLILCDASAVPAMALRPAGEPVVAGRVGAWRHPAGLGEPRQGLPDSDPVDQEVRNAREEAQWRSAAQKLCGIGVGHLADGDQQVSLYHNGRRLLARGGACDQAVFGVLSTFLRTSGIPPHRVTRVAQRVEEGRILILVRSTAQATRSPRRTVESASSESGNLSVPRSDSLGRALLATFKGPAAALN